MSSLNHRPNPAKTFNVVFGLSFGTIFLLLMAIGLPILIHSQQGDWKYDLDKSPATAFFYLGLGLLLWLTVIYLFFKRSLSNLLKAKRDYKDLIKEGKRIKGKIVEQRTLQQTADGESKMIKISFVNLVKSELTFSLPFVDTKPEMNRYQVGKDIGLLVSTDPKKPRIMLEDAKVKIDKSMLIYAYSVLAVLILTPIGLLIYGVLYESQDAGWRYLSFGHPFILSPFLALIYLGVFSFINSFLPKSTNSDRLLLYGKPAIATIVSTQETNLSVNEKPQIMVTIEFQDKGKTIVASFKRMYGLLDISGIAVGNQINILYDAEDPQSIEVVD